MEISSGCAVQSFICSCIYYTCACLLTISSKATWLHRYFLPQITNKTHMHNSLLSILASVTSPSSNLNNLWVGIRSRKPAEHGGGEILSSWTLETSSCELTFLYFAQYCKPFKTKEYCIQCNIHSSPNSMLNCINYCLFRQQQSIVYPGFFCSTLMSILWMILDFLSCL